MAEPDWKQLGLMIKALQGEPDPMSTANSVLRGGGPQVYKNPAQTDSENFIAGVKQAPSIASEALGINDVLKFLREPMSPEEQHDMFVKAAIGAIPMAGVAKAARGAMAGSKATEGIMSNFKKNLAEINKPFPKSKSNIDDTVIERELAKNPGASIFDIAGHPEETLAWPSSKLNKNINVGPEYPTEKWPHLYVELRNLPSEAQWQPPPKAIETGHTVPSHHGTASEEPFSMFRLPEDEIGVHYGSPKAALDIIGNLLYPNKNSRTYPVALKANQPLETPDMGSWGAEKMAQALAKHPDKFSPEEIFDAQAEGIKSVRNLIERKGYDSLKYKNTVEDPGHTSYVLFKESKKNPGYVKGAKSPWAAYKDLESADIMSGIAGLGLLGAGANDPMVRALSK